ALRATAVRRRSRPALRRVPPKRGAPADGPAAADARVRAPSAEPDDRPRRPRPENARTTPPALAESGRSLRPPQPSLRRSAAYGSAGESPLDGLATGHRARPAHRAGFAAPLLWAAGPRPDR